MRWRPQYSLSSILWLTLCLALLLSSVLMYRRMAKAEAENSLLRASAGYEEGESPVFTPPPWSRLEVDVKNEVTSKSNMGGCFIYEYISTFTFRNRRPEEIRLHFPLLRAEYCTPTQAGPFGDLPAPWKEGKTIVLGKGESFDIVMPKRGVISPDDFLKGQNSKDYGRWALAFGVPDGEIPDKYVVGTVLTNPIHWKVELPKEGEKAN